jgi:hypothetical protein
VVRLPGKSTQPSFANFALLDCKLHRLCIWTMGARRSFDPRLLNSSSVYVYIVHTKFPVICSGVDNTYWSVVCRKLRFSHSRHRSNNRIF